LRVYQAVIDARALLAEIYAGSHARTTTSSRSSSSSTSGHEDENDLRTSSHIPWHEAFNVVSTQSTAKPGCVLQLAEINDTDNEVGHIFQFCDLCNKYYCRADKFWMDWMKFASAIYQILCIH
jgi:hypothetical protein